MLGKLRLGLRVEERGDCRPAGSRTRAFSSFKIIGDSKQTCASVNNNTCCSVNRQTRPKSLELRPRNTPCHSTKLISSASSTQKTVPTSKTITRHNWPYLPVPPRDDISLFAMSVVPIVSSGLKLSLHVIKTCDYS